MGRGDGRDLRKAAPAELFASLTTTCWVTPSVGRLAGAFYRGSLAWHRAGHVFIRSMYSLGYLGFMRRQTAPSGPSSFVEAPAPMARMGQSSSIIMML